MSENIFRISPFLDDHTELISLPALMGSNMLCLGITRSSMATKFNTCLMKLVVIFGPVY